MESSQVYPPRFLMEESNMINPSALSYMREVYGERLQENIPLSSYTTARVGGPADAAIIVRSTDELVDVVNCSWEKDIPFFMIGGGSNLLVSDKGVRKLLIINRARKVEFFGDAKHPRAKADSGATLNDIAQKAARSGYGGFEWAATIPGSLGGAIYGNAGAYHGEMSRNLNSIDLIHRQSGLQTWPVEKLAYSYRSSLLKREHQAVVILSAELSFSKSTSESIRRTMEQNATHRRNHQPHGASMGSIFKNPPGDFAGRLIEAAGLKESE